MPPPDTDLGGVTVVELSTGTHSICAPVDDGTIRCWGHGGAGSVALGQTVLVFGQADSSIARMRESDGAERIGAILTARARFACRLFERGPAHQPHPGPILTPS